MLILQTQLNNFFNVVIELLFNKIIYNFKIKNALIVVVDASQMSKNIFNQRLKYQQKIVDVIVFVNVKIKIYYDVKHQFIFFNFNDRVYLRLY